MSMLPLGNPAVPLGVPRPVTCRPQPESPIATSIAATKSRLNIITPLTTRIAAAPLCALALHLAFPRSGITWLVPVGFLGLFACWFGLPLRAAALAGYLAGVAFFWVDFAWFGETAGALVGPLAPLLSLGPALLEGVAFAAAAVIAASAWRRLGPGWAPVVAAAGFAALEWLRSTGVIGVPFGSLGIPLATTALAPVAAFAGGNGLTFCAALVGASLAALLLARHSEGAKRGALVAITAVIAATGLAWLAWPARSVPPPSIVVAAVQGNIVQQLKWTEAARLVALDRYTTMTLALRDKHVRFVLWPETVIPERLTVDPATQARIASVARTVGTTVIAGSIDAHDAASGPYANALFFFAPDGTLAHVYAKHQLVPFVERVPGPAWMHALPYVNLASDFTPGPGSDAYLGIAPLICWESIFSDVGVAQAQRADVLAIATDDAWFGTTAGPYQHAQAASLRAIETGRWVVRAAATGISGIIGPDGRWRERSGLESQETIVGTIGPPQPTAFVHYGPVPIGLAFVVVALAGIALPWRRA